MSKPTFTPGPYRMGATQFIVTTDDHVVAMTKVRGFDSSTFANDDTCRANTLFLCAAPDMYKALDALVNWYGDRVGDDDVLRPPDEQTSRIAAAMESLAKARGKQ